MTYFFGHLKKIQSMTEKCLKKQVLSTTGVANRSIAECQLVDCI